MDLLAFVASFAISAFVTVLGGILIAMTEIEGFGFLIVLGIVSMFVSVIIFAAAWKCPRTN